MKTKLYTIAFFALLFVNQIFAQDVTTVRANNSDISDNLDLKAVASIFGESRDLEDFERRLNDPRMQISNLDLNGDNRVDYLRVIEATERNTHLIILQAVLGIDTFQDVATVEVERDRYNNVQVQVVGDVYMYGPNYIYEPVYVARPIIYDVFWVSTYRPYYSPWYWGYYPTYYSYWAPCPVYRYRNHIYGHINTRNYYNYVNTRRSTRAVALYNTRRANAYERLHPENSFTRRTSASNRYALEQNRRTQTASSSRSEGTRATRSTDYQSSRSNTGITRATRTDNSVRSNNNSVRSNQVQRNDDAGTRSTYTTRAVQPQLNSSSTRSNTQPSTRSIQSTPRQSTPAVRSNPVQQQTRSYSPAPSRSNSAPAVRSNPAPQTRSTPSGSSRSIQGAPSRSAGSNSRGSRG